MITTLLQDQIFLAAGCVLFVALFLLLWLLRLLWHHEDSLTALEGTQEEEIFEDDAPVEKAPLQTTPAVASVAPEAPGNTTLENRLDDIIHRLQAIEQRLNVPAPASAEEKGMPLNAADLEKFIQRLDGRIELLAADYTEKEDVLEKIEAKIDTLSTMINKTSHE